MEHLKLGASLYVPATRSDLTAVALGQKYPTLRSLIIDLEDAIDCDELPLGYQNIKALLPSLTVESYRPLLFIRVRSPACIDVLNDFAHIHHIDGLVLPKFSTLNMHEYLHRPLPGRYFMPVLEKNLHIDGGLARICDYLLAHCEKLLSVRVGATDLLAEFNLRRNCDTVIYDINIINRIITDILMHFGPAGINITAPVYEGFGEPNRVVLENEVRLDLMNGLFGKTVIHPWQVDVVQALYRVSRTDYEAACKLLDCQMPAVFKLHNQMHEKATHTAWAKQIQARAEIYGIT